jgi:hypothetical protein
MVTSLAVMIGLHAWAGERLAWPWYTPIGLVITLVVALGFGRLNHPRLKPETK